MPVGKNALKRVSDGGYSKVKTEAPDMEHSVVEPPVAPEKKPTTKAKAAPKKATTTAKTEPAKKPVRKAKPPVAEKNGFEKIAFGDELPVHLL